MRRTTVPGMLLSIALVIAVTPAVSGASSASSTAGSAPGVTSTKIVTGAVGTLSGPLTADFAGVVPGIRAYFDMVNAAGGIDGRKLDLAYSLDDGGNPSQFTTLVRDLVDQDHVFAVTGVTTDFFSPGFLTETGTPTYGFNTTGGWSGAPNLYGSDGSVQCYTCIVPHIAYAAKQAKAKSIAFLAYNVHASSALCSAASTLMAKAGFKVSYVDLAAPIDGNMAPDVQKIQRAGSDFIVSCMDLDGNISLAREVQQYGVKASQLWFNGYDQSAIDKYSSLMQGVSFFVPSVPLNVPTKDYPGLAVYLKAMRKYEPAYANSALAPEGWISAALFVAGVRAAGSDLTQQRVVKLTNEIASFNGGGLTAPGNWTDGHETNPRIPANYPVCSATVTVKGTTLEPVYVKGKGSQVFLCLGAGAVKDPVPLTPPAGTPGP